MKEEPLLLNHTKKDTIEKEKKEHLKQTVHSTEQDGI